MSPCDSHEVAISALLDGELSTEEERSLRAHLEQCPGCRHRHDELVQTRDLLAAEFQATMLAAPPAPRTRRRWFPRYAAGLGATAAAALAVAFLWPRTTIEATPLKLLERAAEQHREVEDVELYATVDSGIIELFAMIAGNKKKEPSETHFRILIKKPNRVLVHSVVDLESREVEKDGERMGFDGRKFWQYDLEEKVVRVSETETFELRSGGTKISLEKKALGGKNSGLLGYLSWDLVKTLADEAGKHDIVEITGPADRRARRRVFRLVAAPSKEGESQWVWDRTELTIDPRENLIERMVFDLELAGFNVVRIKLELADVNNGFPDSLFDYRRYVPPGTREEGSR